MTLFYEPFRDSESKLVKTYGGKDFLVKSADSQVQIEIFERIAKQLLKNIPEHITNSENTHGFVEALGEFLEEYRFKIHEIKYMYDYLRSFHTDEALLHFGENPILLKMTEGQKRKYHRDILNIYRTMGTANGLEYFFRLLEWIISIDHIYVKKEDIDRQTQQGDLRYPKDFYFVHGWKVNDTTTTEFIDENIGKQKVDLEDFKGFRLNGAVYGDGWTEDELIANGLTEVVKLPYIRIKLDEKDYEIFSKDLLNEFDNIDFSKEEEFERFKQITDYFLFDNRPVNITITEFVTVDRPEDYIIASFFDDFKINENVNYISWDTFWSWDTMLDSYKNNEIYFGGFYDFEREWCRYLPKTDFNSLNVSDMTFSNGEIRTDQLQQDYKLSRGRHYGRGYTIKFLKDVRITGLEGYITSGRIGIVSASSPAQMSTVLFEKHITGKDSIIIEDYQISAGDSIHIFSIGDSGRDAIYGWEERDYDYSNFLNHIKTEYQGIVEMSPENAVSYTPGENLDNGSASLYSGNNLSESNFIPYLKLTFDEENSETTSFLQDEYTFSRTYPAGTTGKQDIIPIRSTQTIITSNRSIYIDYYTGPRHRIMEEMDIPSHLSTTLRDVSFDLTGATGFRVDLRNGFDRDVTVNIQLK